MIQPTSQTPIQHTTTAQNVSEKPAPHHIRHRLTKDVNSILSTCIHHFDDVEREMKETSFDVDAVVSGRSVPQRTTYERMTVAPTPVVRQTAEQTAAASMLTLPSRGFFIPSAHFTPVVRMA